MYQKPFWQTDVNPNLISGWKIFKKDALVFLKENNLNYTSEKKSTTSSSSSSRGRKKSSSSKNISEETKPFEIDKHHFKTIFKFFHDIGQRISSVNVTYIYKIQNIFLHFIDFHYSF